MSSVRLSMRDVRINKELEKLKYKPPWGIWIKRNNHEESEQGISGVDILEAGLCGPRSSPYSEGLFILKIIIPVSYPHEPPQVNFVTPVYHPNIDQGGRICLDMLKMQPRGDWRPTLTLESVLVSIQTLLASPNPDDPLVMDIAKQYISDREAFNAAAKEATLKYAKQDAKEG